MIEKRFTIPERDVTALSHLIRQLAADYCGADVEDSE